jgi:hypothetical protein
LQPVDIPERAVTRLGVDRGHLHDPDDADAEIDRELRVGRLKELLPQPETSSSVRCEPAETCSNRSSSMASQQARQSDWLFPRVGKADAIAMTSFVDRGAISSPSASQARIVAGCRCTPIDLSVAVTLRTSIEEDRRAVLHNEARSRSWRYAASPLRCSASRRVTSLSPPSRRMRRVPGRSSSIRTWWTDVPLARVPPCDSVTDRRSSVMASQDRPTKCTIRA